VISSKGLAEMRLRIGIIAVVGAVAVHGLLAIGLAHLSHGRPIRLGAPSAPASENAVATPVNSAAQLAAPQPQPEAPPQPKPIVKTDSTQSRKPTSHSHPSGSTHIRRARPSVVEQPTPPAKPPVFNLDVDSTTTGGAAE